MSDWQDILSRDGSAVWQTAYRYLGNRADTDECFQEAFLAAFALGMEDKTFLNLETAAEGLLRNFAARTGGTFPKRIGDFNEFDKEFPKKVGVLPDAEMFRAVQSLVRFTLATPNLKGGFGYKSDGVKLGDADKILFWYRPEGAAHYRAIYGDLHAADVTEDNLPEKPKP